MFVHELTRRRPAGVGAAVLLDELDETVATADRAAIVARDLTCRFDGFVLALGLALFGLSLQRFARLTR